MTIYTTQNTYAKRNEVKKIKYPPHISKPNPTGLPETTATGIQTESIKGQLSAAVSGHVMASKSDL